MNRRMAKRFRMVRHHRLVPGEGVVVTVDREIVSYRIDRLARYYDRLPEEFWDPSPRVTTRGAHKASAGRKRR